MSAWAEWESCSVTCGSGERTRSRTCDQGCADVPNDDLEETESCNEVDCPLYCISISSTPSSDCVTRYGNDRSAEYDGDTATVFHNNVQIGTLPQGFSNEEFCITGVDVVNDQFKIVNGGQDGVSFSFMHNDIVQFV